MPQRTLKVINYPTTSRKGDILADIIQLNVKRPRLPPNERPKPMLKRELLRRARRNALQRRRPRMHEDLPRRLLMRAKRTKPREGSVFAAPSKSLI